MIATLKELKSNAHTYEAQKITAELGYAVMLSQENSGCFKKEIEEAISFLKKCYDHDGAITKDAVAACEMRLKPLESLAKSYTVYCASHAHIDMNWMWGYNETVAITLDTFRTILKLLEEYPEFIFSQSQASTYAIAEKYDPVMFAQIQDAVCKGRWEVTATSWVESDRNMINSESVIRHVLASRKYFKEKFGLSEESLRLAFEPDAFGHSRYTPEALSKCGIRYYYHCRGYEGPFAYSWEAPSGARLLVYRDFDWYNMSICTDFIEHVPVVCRQIPNRICLKVYGVGDHGGGPTRKDIERLIDMSTWSIAPTICFSTYHNFYQELEKVWDELPVKRDEHAFVFTGCYSSESRLKMANHHGEDRLYEAEAAAALSHVYAEKSNYTVAFEEAWKCLLFNQFHDILPGSGVTETREYAMGKYQELLGYTYVGQNNAFRAMAKKIDTSAFFANFDKRQDTSDGAGVGYYRQDTGCDRSALIITPEENGCGEMRLFHIFNPLPFQRQECVRLVVWDYPEGLHDVTVTDANGKSLLFEIGATADYWAHKSNEVDVFVSVPAMGYTTCILQRVSPASYKPRPSIEPRIEPFYDSVLENDLVVARFNIHMQLISLKEKDTGKEWVVEPTGDLILRESNGRDLGRKAGDAWREGDILREYSLNAVSAIHTEQIKHGILSQTLTYSMLYSHSRITVKVILEKGSPMLHYQIDVEWGEIGNEQVIPSLLFRVVLPYSCTRYRYEIANGVLDRSACTHAVSSRSYICGIPQEGCGLALFCDSQYGYTGNDNTLTLTLLRASQYPDKWPEIGSHTYQVGLSPTDNSPIELMKMSQRLVHPLAYISNTAHNGQLPLEGQFFSVNGQVELSSVRPAEGEPQTVILRLYDISGQDQQAEIVFAKNIQEAWLLSGDEQSSEMLHATQNAVHLCFKPYEIHTVKVSL